MILYSKFLFSCVGLPGFVFQVFAFQVLVCSLLFRKDKDSDDESFYWVKKQEFSREKRRYSRVDVSGETPIDPKNMDSLVDSIMGNKTKTSSSMTRAAILDKDQSDDSSDDPIFKKAVKPKGKGQLAIKDAPSEPKKKRRVSSQLKLQKKRRTRRGRTRRRTKRRRRKLTLSRRRRMRPRAKRASSSRPFTSVRSGRTGCTATGRRGPSSTPSRSHGLSLLRLAVVFPWICFDLDLFWICC